jgi:hypothetical protein
MGPPQLMTAGMDTTCPASTETTVLAIGGNASPDNLAAANAGAALAVAQGVLAITLGSSAPSALAIDIATTAGTPIDTYNVPAGLLVNSAVILVPFTLVIPASAALWKGSGSTPLIEVTATGEAVTVTDLGSEAYIFLSEVTA